jgi:aspartate racemase
MERWSGTPALEGTYLEHYLDGDLFSIRLIEILHQVVQDMRSKRMGMIGGVGPAATVLYYQQIIACAREKMGGDQYPEILIHSLDLGEVNVYFNHDDLDGLTDKLVSVGNWFESAGCEFMFMACNAMHMAFEKVRKQVNLPMLSIIEAVLEEAQERQLNRVGIMGTTFVMRSGLYRMAFEAAGIECLEPDEAEQGWIMEAILGDLQRPSVPEDTITRLLRDVEKLGSQGAEAVVLGCTDLPMAITEGNSPAPLLDTTRIHVNRIMDFAYDQGKAVLKE